MKDFFTTGRLASLVPVVPRLLGKRGEGNPENKTYIQTRKQRWSGNVKRTKTNMETDGIKPEKFETKISSEVNDIDKISHNISNNKCNFTGASGFF